jgi:DNA-binding NarL/FixJ family response regulator
MKVKSVSDILLIDDDSDEFLVFELALNEVSSEINLIHIRSISQSLSEIQNCKADLIFLDLKLGFKNGFECLKELKAHARFCDTPIIVYSSSSRPQDINFSYQLGAALYFIKTSSFPELVDAIKKILMMPWLDPEGMRKNYNFKERSSPFKLEAE